MSYFSLTNSDCMFTGDEILRSFWSKVAPEAPRFGTRVLGGAVGGGQRKHDG